METRRKYQNLPISLAPVGSHQSTMKKTPVPSAPANMKGFRLPQRDRELSDQVPISGSNKASIARGIAKKGLKPVPRKAMLSLRVDADVLAWFRAQGEGYQTRMNALLRAYMEAHL